MKKKKILFFLVHPAKFHFHKVQINKLIKLGHDIDIIITQKDILEELVNEEGWKYTNLFPEGRKLKFSKVFISIPYFFVATLYRLFKFTNKKKYDLFIGDLLTFIGIIRNVPCLFPTDDVLSAVPQGALLYQSATNVIAPYITDLGIYNKKTINYYGYKAVAHLHPNHFKPNKSLLSQDLIENSYFMIRCTGFMASHDIGKKGIDNKLLNNLIDILKPHGKIIITSERELPENLKKYQIKIKKTHVNHFMYYAKLFISDSTTMTSEAAYLGTPSLEFDDYFHEIDQMLELQNKYGLIYCFRTFEEKQFIQKVKELSPISNLKDLYTIKREKLISDSIDVSSFLVWFYENYPTSSKLYFENPSLQNKFH